MPVLDDMNSGAGAGIKLSAPAFLHRTTRTNRTLLRESGFMKLLQIHVTSDWTRKETAK